MAKSKSLGYSVPMQVAQVPSQVSTSKGKPYDPYFHLKLANGLRDSFPKNWVEKWSEEEGGLVKIKFIRRDENSYEPVYELYEIDYEEFCEMMRNKRDY